MSEHELRNTDQIDAERVDEAAKDPVQAAMGCEVIDGDEVGGLKVWERDNEDAWLFSSQYEEIKQ